MLGKIASYLFLISKLTCVLKIKLFFHLVFRQKLIEEIEHLKFSDSYLLEIIGIKF